MGGLALLNPGRYQVTFVAQDWFQFLIPALIAIPAIALFQGLVYAYLLQGLGLLIRQPVWLAITIALTTGLLSQLGQPASVIIGMIAISTAWLMVWIVLQNQGIELLLGLCMAQSALSLLVLTSPDAPAAFPALLLRVDPIPDLAAIITRLMTMALFYGICLGLPWQRR